MDVNSVSSVRETTVIERASSPKQYTEEELKEAFTDFVGQTLFGSMLASMRKTVGKPAYMHGGRGEEIFQQQLDQKIVEELTDASGSDIVDPMYQLFHMKQM